MATLRTLLQSGLSARLVGDAETPITGARVDSREVQPGDVFIAVPGLRRDGAGFAAEAVARGASAIAAERELPIAAAQLIVPDARAAVGAIAEHAYGHPTRALRVAAVTGTNGKTTSTYLLEAILQHAGRRPAVMGTVSFRFEDEVLDVPHTTAEGDRIARLAAHYRRRGATDLVMEASSHALELRRVDAIAFDVCVFTNLTRDHLDFHGSRAAYAAAKRRLFTDLAAPVSVLNVDDAFGRELVDAAPNQVLRTSCAPDAAADVRPLESEFRRDGLRALVRTPSGRIAIESPLIGRHNLANVLGAVGASLALDVPLESIAGGLAGCRGAPGRLEPVPHEGSFGVYVDYAHTPDALANVLRCARSLTTGRVLLVFGCGGERDASKRAPMGRVAAAGADVCVLTSDNPRRESASEIEAMVLEGIREAPRSTSEPLVVADRRQAISAALSRAQPGDVVLIAGKGHEAVQEIGGERVPFDDRQVARELLLSRPRRRSVSASRRTVDTQTRCDATDPDRVAHARGA